MSIAKVFWVAGVLVAISIFSTLIIAWVSSKSKDDSIGKNIYQFFIATAILAIILMQIGIGLGLKLF